MKTITKQDLLSKIENGEYDDKKLTFFEIFGDKDSCIVNESDVKTVIGYERTTLNEFVEGFEVGTCMGEIAVFLKDGKLDHITN